MPVLCMTFTQRAPFSRLEACPAEVLVHLRPLSAAVYHGSLSPSFPHQRNYDEADEDCKHGEPPLELHFASALAATPEAESGQFVSCSARRKKSCICGDGRKEKPF